MGGVGSPLTDPFAEFGGKTVTHSEDPFKEFGGTVVQKKVGAAGSALTSPPSITGFNSFPASPDDTNIPNAIYTPEKRQQLVQAQRAQDLQVARQKAAQNKQTIDRLHDIVAKLPKEDQDALNSFTGIQSNDKITQTPQEEIDHQKFMDEHPVLKAVGYLGGKVSHGSLQILKGIAHISNMAMNPVTATTGYDPTEEAFNPLDKAANLGLTENDINDIEGGKGIGKKALSAAGMLAEFAPSIAGGEAMGAPKALLYLQGMGQGIETAKKVGVKNQLAKEALIQGSGAVNLLMSDLGGEMWGKGVSNAVKKDVVSGITADAIAKSAGKDLSSTEFKALLNDGVKTFVEKFKKAPIDALQHYTNTVKTLAKVDVGNFAVHKAVDVLNDKPVFNETPGDLAASLYKTTTQDSPVFAALPMVAELTKLTPFSKYKNDVIESVVNNSSDENIKNIKEQLEQHGKDNNWTDEQIKATTDHVDKIAKAAKVIPETIDPAKKSDAIGLVLDRNDLQEKLGKLQDNKDPALKDVNTPQEEFLANKIEQANDKLRSLVSGKRTTYSKGIGDDEGKFFKTTDGKKEEITQSRYDLEHLERKANEQPAQIEQATENGLPQAPQEVVPEKADEELTNNQITNPTENEKERVGEEAQKGEGIQEGGENGNAQQGISTEEKVSEGAENAPLQQTEKPIRESLPKATKDFQAHEVINYDTTEKNTYKPNEQLKFNQGDNYEPVRIVGDPDMIKLISIGSKRSKMDGITRPYDKVEEKELTQKLDISSIDAYNKAKSLAKENRSTHTEKIVVLGDTKKGEVENAVQEQSTGEVRVRNEATMGKGVGEGNAEPKEPTKQSQETKVSEKAKVLADKIRSLKSNKNILHGGLQGVATAVYDGALETAATVIEQGGKLIDAIQAAIDHIKRNSDEKDDDKIKAAITKDLTDAGIEEQSEDEKATYGTKNAITEELQHGLGLPPIEIPKDRSDEESLAAWKNGTRTPQEIVEQLLNPDTNIYDKSITPNDEPIMREYIRQLGERGRELNKIKIHLQEKADAGDEQAKYDVESVGVQIDRHLDEYNNALNASKVGGNVWHKYGDERQKAIDDQGLILNAIERIKNIYGKDIPADIKAKLDDLQKRHDELAAKNELLEQQAKNSVAAQNFERVKPKRTIFGTKKLSDTEFNKVKTDILTDLKKDWKKSFAKTYATLPGVPQFNALAPHITKLMSLYLNRGISKLDDVISYIHNDIKDELEGITKQDISDIIAGRYSSQKPLSDLQKQVNELRTQARNKIRIAELEKGIIAKTKAKGEASLEVKTLQKQVQELKKQALNQYAHLSAEQLKKEQAIIQKRIDKGEFFKLPEAKRRFENDPAWLKNNKEKADIMYKLRKMETEAMNSRKSAYMRTLDLVNRWGRRIIFFGANAVYTHLASSAVVGSLLHRWPEFLAGKVVNRAFPLLAKGAPIEGNLSLKTEAKFWRRIINLQQTAKNTASIFMTGETDLSKELATRKHEKVIPGLDFLAAGGHQAIKDPILEATFNASQEAYMDYYRTHGIDETHPLMLEVARQAAWQRSQYEIFQNTAKNANIIKTWINQLEKKSIANAASASKYDRAKGNAQYTAVSIYRFMVPINTAPTNMVERSVLAWRLPDKIVKAIDANGALKKGIDKLSAEDKDLLLLQLKKGAVGAFYWTAGFMLGGTAAGGLYTKFYPNTDREKTITDPDSQYLNLGGLNVGKDWQHNYQLQSLQDGATFRMIYGHYRNDKDESAFSAYLKASFATSEAVSEQLPTIKAASDLKEAGTTPKGEEKYLKNLKRRVGIKKAEDLGKLMGYGSDDDTP